MSKLSPTKTVLTLLGPVIAAASAWLAGAVAKYGVHLSKSGIAAVMTAGVVAGVALALKLIHDVEHNPQELKAAETAIADVDPSLAKELEGGWPAAAEAPTTASGG